jgi:TonB family protein
MFEERQPRKLMLALVLLLVAFATVIIKDRQFWFGSFQETEIQDSDVAQPSVNHRATTQSKTAGSLAPAVSASKVKKSVRTSDLPKLQSSADTGSQSGDAGSSTSRMALPPLDVEVVAGDSHRTLHPGSNQQNLQISDSEPAPDSGVAAARNAAELQRMSTGSQSLKSSQAASQVTLDATYPLLGQHTNVEGSVILQAVIGADGNIQNLRVLSGPSILAAAAQQAVRQWRFKPYLQNGQAVETKARITVNFSIKVADSAPKAS